MDGDDTPLRSQLSAQPANPTPPPRQDRGEPKLYVDINIGKP